LFFDATSYLRKPNNLRQRGLWPAVCETSGTIEEFARRALAQHALLVLDLEPIPGYGQMPEKEVDELLARYEAAVDRARAVGPTLSIGCYHYPNNDRELRSRRPDGTWDDRGLLDRLNFSAPQAYFYRNETYETWEEDTAKRLAVAKRYERPVYAFVNVTHFTEPYEPVDEGLLHRAVEFIRSRADGIIWWGGWYYIKPKGGGESIWRPYLWKDDASWMKAMRPPSAAAAPATAAAAAPATRPARK
jgi:hypothetical protein